jgi:hypothetical protein
VKRRGGVLSCRALVTCLATDRWALFRELGLYSWSKLGK